MAIDYGIGTYDPCPCGSGKKYKFCCAAKAKSIRHGKFPVGTVAFYGPDDKTTTKIAAAAVLSDISEPIVQRWLGEGVKEDAKVADQIKQFFARYGVKSVVVTDAIIGCPHEEGVDFPEGTECPFCPFWTGKQGILVRSTANSGVEVDSDEDDRLEIKAVEQPADELDEDNERMGAAVDRVTAIVGAEVDDREAAVDKAFEWLQANLQLPCKVRAIEDLNWEEPYVFGGWDRREFKRLRKTQPSCEDEFQLLSISRGESSEWMLFGDEDIAARVKRISDDKLFILGLAELEAIDPTSANYQLLHDYAVWFVNTR
jgi:hypothetical protein